jgi:hypothetical protein
MSNIVMPATPAAPARITSAILLDVIPPIARTGIAVAHATADSSWSPAATRSGFEVLSKTVPKMR